MNIFEDFCQFRNLTIIIICLTTAFYSVFINGEPKGWITQSRGLRQGDPLSPYLFLLCAEGLTTLLNKAVENQVVNGIMSCQNGVCISHLLFANDSLLFCKYTIGECQQLLSILGQYEAASGQAINCQKTSLFLARTQILKYGD